MLEHGTRQLRTVITAARYTHRPAMVKQHFTTSVSHYSTSLPSILRLQKVESYRLRFLVATKASKSIVVRLAARDRCPFPRSTASPRQHESQLHLSPCSTTQHESQLSLCSSKHGSNCISRHTSLPARSHSIDVPTAPRSMGTLNFLSSPQQLFSTSSPLSWHHNVLYSFSPSLFYLHLLLRFLTLIFHRRGASGFFFGRRTASALVSITGEPAHLLSQHRR